MKTPKQLWEDCTSKWPEPVEDLTGDFTIEDIISNCNAGIKYFESISILVKDTITKAMRFSGLDIKLTNIATMDANIPEDVTIPKKLLAAYYEDLDRRYTIKMEIKDNLPEPFENLENFVKVLHYMVLFEVEAGLKLANIYRAKAVELLNPHKGQIYNSYNNTWNWL